MQSNLVCTWLTVDYSLQVHTKFDCIIITTAKTIDCIIITTVKTIGCYKLDVYLTDMFIVQWADLYIR